MVCIVCGQTVLNFCREYKGYDLFRKPESRAKVVARLAAAASSAHLGRAHLQSAHPAILQVIYI